MKNRLLPASRDPTCTFLFTLFLKTDTAQTSVINIPQLFLVVLTFLYVFLNHLIQLCLLPSFIKYNHRVCTPFLFFFHYICKTLSHFVQLQFVKFHFFFFCQQLNQILRGLKLEAYIIYVGKYSSVHGISYEDIQ